MGWREEIRNRHTKGIAVVRKIRAGIRLWQGQRDERHHPWAGISRNAEPSSHVRKRQGDFSANGGGRARYRPAMVCVVGTVGTEDRNGNKSFKTCFYFFHCRLLLCYCHCFARAEQQNLKRERQGSYPKFLPRAMNQDHTHLWFIQWGIL